MTICKMHRIFGMPLIFNNFFLLQMTIMFLEKTTSLEYSPIALFFIISEGIENKQGRKRPLDTPKRMIEREDREKERER